MKRPEIQCESFPVDHVLEPGEVNNLVYMVCRTARWSMRGADLAMVEAMRDHKLTGVLAVRNVVATAAEFVWDHILGEPRKPTVSSLYHTVAPWVSHFLAQPIEKRRSTT